MNRRVTFADGDGLQADVMRFMAIIAFCLLAILALVRNVSEPPPRSEPDDVRVPTPTPEPAVEPVAKVAAERAPEPVVVAEVPVPAVEPAPAPIPAPEPIAVVESIPDTVAPVPVAFVEVEEVDEISEPLPDPLPVPQVEPAAAPEPAREPGLSLRFASHRDFLRLIGRGDVGVFLFDASAPQHAWRLDSGFEFVADTAPAQLYEMLPATIPDAVSRAAGRVPDAGRYTWGVTMPHRVEAQIQRYLGIVASGELLIDRFGGVRHVGG